MSRTLFAVGFVMLAMGCSREGSTQPVTTPPPSSSSSSASSPASAAPASIGVAKMLADGTLQLDLHGPGGAEARVLYPPTHAEYKKTLTHLGGMKPGESKSVPPWPDPWDAAKVEAAAHAYAAKKGWAKGDYKMEITGTDKDGNAVVSLRHLDDKTPGAGKSVTIRIETTGYTVAGETGQQ